MDDPMRGWAAFSQAARNYFGAANRPAAVPDAAQQFGDFLREQFATAFAPWSGTDASSSAPTSLFDAPAFGATREHQQRAQRILEATQRIDAAQRRLQRLWSDVIREAATKFVGQLTSSPADANPESWRKLYDTWIDCAEDAYARTAHGEAFCQAQAELVNASSQWRQEQQASIEHWLKTFDLPTRGEINSLMRRLRAVEAQLRSMSAQAKTPAAATRAAKKSGQLKRSKKK
jgi:class III poly(R)-hydroxyalkanoic acid synthase PhaE subunit